MAHGTTKGQVDSNFSERIYDLEAYAKDIAERFRTWSGLRIWHTPTIIKDRELLDVPSLHEPPWNRNNINQIYSETILAGPGAQGGTAGDLIAMKTQADFMATEERAFRLRQASYARCQALMHSRLDGHGKTGEGVFSTLEKGVKEYIKVGQAHGAGDSEQTSGKGDFNVSPGTTGLA